MQRASLTNKVLRLVATAGHRLLRPKRRQGLGAHALALTPERRIILVRLRYAPGWRLPGGGRDEREELRDAVLRELREEIGMISHGSVQPAVDSVMIVEDVVYRPRRWSWEVEAICEADIGRLPAGLAQPAERWLEALRDKL